MFVKHFCPKVAQKRKVSKDQLNVKNLQQEHVCSPSSSKHDSVKQSEINLPCLTRFHINDEQSSLGVTLSLCSRDGAPENRLQVG